MTVKISKIDGYVTVAQDTFSDEPTNLKPDEARDLAENLNQLADEVEDE
jgi:hypothetical protein